MSSVTFSVGVGGDGSTVTDDSNATTGLAGGGHRVRFVPALTQTVAVANNVVTKAAQAVQAATDATAAKVAAEAAAATATGTSAFVDTNPVVKGSVDATKLLRFEVDGFTTNTTRVLTPPNYSGTIATLAGTETLTNKTITSPTISGATLNGATIVGAGGTLALSADPSTALQAATKQYVDAQVSDKAMVLLGTATVGAAVASINFLNLFSSAYDKYTIEIQQAYPSSDDVLHMRVAAAGAAITSTSYYVPSSSGNMTSTASALVPSTALSKAINAIGATYTIEIRNANNTATNAFKGISFRGSNHTTASAMEVIIKEGGITTTSALSGFTLYWATAANFAGGTVRVYGHKN